MHNVPICKRDINSAWCKIKKIVLTVAGDVEWRWCWSCHDDYERVCCVNEVFRLLLARLSKHTNARAVCRYLAATIHSEQGEWNSRYMSNTHIFIFFCYLSSSSCFFFFLTKRAFNFLQTNITVHTVFFDQLSFFAPDVRISYVQYISYVFKRMYGVWSIWWHFYHIRAVYFFSI